MYAKRTPRIEYAAYLPESVRAGAVSGNIPVEDMTLEKFTVKALKDAGIETYGQVVELLASHVENPQAELPKGIGPRRIAELDAAIKGMEHNDTWAPGGGVEIAMIFAALEAVARRCGTNALYHSGEILQHNGRRAIRMRWSAGMGWRSLVRNCKASDKHFHACPLRRGGGEDPITEILDD